MKIYVYYIFQFIFVYIYHCIHSILFVLQYSYLVIFSINRCFSLILLNFFLHFHILQHSFEKRIEERGHKGFETEYVPL